MDREREKKEGKRDPSSFLSGLIFGISHVPKWSEHKFIPGPRSFYLFL